MTVYYDSNIAIEQEDINIGLGETIELSFEWNTTSVPYGNYTIKAVASILDDVNIINNEFEDGKLVVAQWGDLDGSGAIDISDCVIFANTAGSWPENARWNPLADLNYDELIDLFDSILLAKLA